MTIRELFFTSILNTYKQLQASNRGMAGLNQYKKMSKNFFNQLLKGRVNLKMLAHVKLMEMPEEERRTIRKKIEPFEEVY